MFGFLYSCSVLKFCSVLPLLEIVAFSLRFKILWFFIFVLISDT